MKARLLKITLSFAMLFIAAGTFAQITDYPRGNQINTGSVASPVDSVTAGQPIPYFVSPDPVLNPSFDDTYDPNNTGDGLNSSEDWVWWTGTTGVGGFTANQGVDADGNTDGPYIEVTWTAPGGAPARDSIYVQEVNSSLASCGGDTTALEVLVFDPPSFTPVDNTGATETNALIELCGDNLAYPINLASISDNGVDGGDLKIRLDSISVDNVSASAIQGGSNTQVRFAEDTVAVIPNASGSQSDVNLFNYDIEVRNNSVTRYRFVFAESDGDDTDGISDMISRKSDYLAVNGSTPGDDQPWTYYAPNDAGAGTTRDIVVYPKPQTGDIYYVPHDFDQ